MNSGVSIYIISSHGFQACENVFFLNLFLKKNGLLASRQNADGTGQVVDYENTKASCSRWECQRSNN